MNVSDFPQIDGFLPELWCPSYSRLWHEIMEPPLFFLFSICIFIFNRMSVLFHLYFLYLTCSCSLQSFGKSSLHVPVSQKIRVVEVIFSFLFLKNSPHDVFDITLINVLSDSVWLILKRAHFEIMRNV